MPWPHDRACQGSAVAQAETVGQWLLAGDGYVSILPGTGAEMLAPVHPRKGNTPGAACGWGARVHMLAGLAGIFSSEVIFHFVRGGRRKGSIICQTREGLGGPKTQSVSALSGLPGAWGLCIFRVIYSWLSFQLASSPFTFLSGARTEWLALWVFGKERSSFHSANTSIRAEKAQSVTWKSFWCSAPRPGQAKCCPWRTDDATGGHRLGSETKMRDQRGEGSE